ncbi:MAG TPA: YgiQ family radical SAM protein [Candidatus Nanoarchaeia archaeon]|nr:YgiQ family radical SAM protein [Candidatus Nanoarchaeia archaeon]
MISTIPLKNSTFDIIIISGEYYDDHPFSPVGVIARVLAAQSYSVGIIEKPKTKADFTSLGLPKLFFGIASGTVDSMLYNYSSLKRSRSEDPHAFLPEIPERAVIYYCNKLREYFPGCRLILGGVEASLRRFAHYDYWDNKVRKSILLDSRANLLIYGSGEKQILEVAEKIKNKQELKGILGTSILSKELPPDFIELPAFQEVNGDNEKSKIAFCKMQTQFSLHKNLAQRYDNNYILQYKYPEYTTKDLDWIYALPYTRQLHPQSLLGMAKFSVVTHRGCIGRCNFCSITLHQGDKIVSRSEENILKEIKDLTKHPDFEGYIDDLGGPSANMYGMDCVTKCPKPCLGCTKLDRSHSKIIQLLRKARQIPGIKKIFIRSGIRYDLALESKEYLKEISEHHISGCLKIAPEHFSSRVLKLMNKEDKTSKGKSSFEEFKQYFEVLNKNKNQSLRYYFMIGHPGDDEKEVSFLVSKLKQLQNLEQFQIFTPTPMTDSTCMYWTGLNPSTLEKVKVIYDFKTKKRLRDMILDLTQEKTVPSTSSFTPRPSNFTPRPNSFTPKSNRFASRPKSFTSRTSRPNYSKDFS